MQVDHFLPQKHFKFLSLCWENMIPLCGDCNRKKWTFTPLSLTGKNFAENFLDEISSDKAIPFDKTQILGVCTDRLIDPSFDNPEKHINFDPASRQFEPLTPIGEIMVEYFFNRVRSFHKHLKILSDRVKIIVETHETPEKSIKIFLIDVSGYSFYVRKFYDYWSEVKHRCCEEGV
jgi:hypothetical protein